MEQQARIRCTIMRGGTSKAVFVLKNALPKDPIVRDRVILAIFGSPDVRQIDGLGGADPLTSKLAIIGPPSRSDADVDYTFGQVEINIAKVDYTGNCGNISSAVGPFAIDEGFVDAREPITKVRIHNTNTGKIIIAEVPTSAGKAAVNGNYHIDGVPNSGAKIAMEWTGSVGAATGELLPTGKVRDVVEGVNRKIEVSIIDAGNASLFVKASDVGLEGTEKPSEFDSKTETIEQLERICENARKLCPALKSKSSIYFVSKPLTYTNFATQEKINSKEIDLISRNLFHGVMHKAYPGTGTVSTSIAAKLPGTVVYDLVPKDARARNLLRIGHPSGIIEVETIIEQKGQEFTVKRVSFGRTARRIMDGYVYVPLTFFAP